ISLAGLAVLALAAAPTTAHAQDPGPTAPDLAVAFDGPATAVAGSTEVWTLTVRNDGTAAASGFTVSTVLPAGVRAALRSAPADWSTCVLGVAAGAGEVSVPSDLSCTYDGELAAGEQATVLPVELSFDAALLGPQQIGAVASPAGGEAEEALVNNRSSRTTTLSAPPVETTTPVTAPVTAPVSAPAAAPIAAPAAAPIAAPAAARA
ncbi:MAG: DUF11 domain-containing protein, partial [Actinomycetota bacterium]|nr:DUF11 domain-containing protein [Actinomycetota bacterium]